MAALPSLLLGRHFQDVWLLVQDSSRVNRSTTGLPSCSCVLVHCGLLPALVASSGSLTQVVSIIRLSCTHAECRRTPKPRGPPRALRSPTLCAQAAARCVSLLAYVHASLSHWPLLAEHKREDKMIQNLKMATAKH